MPSGFAGSNKFFGGGETSSEEERDSDSEGSSSEEQNQNINTDKSARQLRAALVGDDVSEEEEDRKVRTQKEKRTEVLDNIRKKCEVAANNGDFDKLETDFNVLCVEIEKSREVIYEGKNEKLPKNIIKTLIVIQETIDSVSNAEKKKFSKVKAGNFNKVKQNFKKWLQSEDNSIDATFEKQIEEFKANPEASEEEEESDEEEAESDEEESEEEEESGDEKEEAKKEDKEEDYEYYDEEAPEGEDSDDVPIKVEDVDQKLKQRYIFLFKAREDMKPEERRWKWVRQDCLPEDMKKLLGVGQEKKKDKKDDEVEDGDKEKEEKEFKETVVAVSNYHELDYNLKENVFETMKKLKEERRSTKFK